MLHNIRQVEDKIMRYISSGVQAIQLVVGGQAAAAVQMLNRIAANMDLKVAEWNPAQGFGAPVNAVNPVQALSMASEGRIFRADRCGTGQVDPDANEGIVIMHDIHYDMNALPALVTLFKKMVSERRFNRQVVTDNRMVNMRRPLFILTTGTSINPDVLPYLKVLEVPLPSYQELSFELDDVLNSVPEESRECAPELRHSIINALSGLNSAEASDTLAESIVIHGRLCPAVIDTIEEEKGLLLKKSEVLSYTPKSEIMGINDLGGFSELKQWLDHRSVAYSVEAEHLKLAMPKGIVLVGVPGTGKSRCAQLIARKLQQPLIRFDLGAVFNSLVGESERRTRETIRIADALGGCVLLIDEADKVLGGAGESTGDSGVTRRIFGQILTWLAEKQSKTFVVLTMNRVTGMPPELLRRGRFDEIFFVDTPDETERKEIFEIHMRNNHVDPTAFSNDDWRRVVEATDEFVGAEIQQAVLAARFSAYAKDPTSRAVFDADCLLSTIREIVPVTKMDPVNIDAIRSFGRERARNVSGRRQRTVKQQARSMDLTFSDPNLAR
jgi:SpoVK/Ycf46/Vps4 family AAA+-type ATPase